MKKESKEQRKTIELEAIKSKPIRERLKIKTHSDDYFIPEETEEKINYGNIVHEVLSMIQCSEELPNAIDKFIFEGKINRLEGADIKETLEKALQHPTVQPWFDKNVTVKREASILSDTDSRPDRVIINGNQAIVVDFKTGKQAKSHSKQVRDYMDLLKKMNYSQVEGYLWYINENEIIKVENQTGNQQLKLEI